MHNDPQNKISRRDLVAELEIDPDDGSLIAAAARLRDLCDEPPSEAVATHQIQTAAALASEMAARPTTARHRGMMIMGRAAAAAAALLIATGGAAYAGVLPGGFGSAVGHVTSSLGLSEPKIPHSIEVADEVGRDETGTDVVVLAEVIEQPADPVEKEKPPTTTTTAAKAGEEMPKDERPQGDTKIREIPPEIAAMMQSTADYRKAAREWRRCVIGLGPDRSEPADPTSCGDAPTPEEFGITQEALAELSEKAQARVARLVDPITAKLSCIESHSGDRKGMRECLAGASKVESKKSEPPRDDPKAKSGDRRRSDDPAGRDHGEDERESRRGGEPPRPRHTGEREQLGDGGGKHRAR